MKALWLHPSQGGAYDVLQGFIALRIWGERRSLEGGTIMAVVDGADVLGACLFHNWDTESGVIEMTAASASPRWLSRPMLREMFSYVFDQLACQLAVMRVDPANVRMCRIASAFGFKRYDIPRLRGRDKAEAIFVLGDDDWRNSLFGGKTSGQKRA